VFPRPARVRRLAPHAPYLPRPREPLRQPGQQIARTASGGAILAVPAAFACGKRSTLVSRVTVIGLRQRRQRSIKSGLVVAPARAFPLSPAPRRFLALHLVQVISQGRATLSASLRSHRQQRGLTSPPRSCVSVVISPSSTSGSRPRCPSLEAETRLLAASQLIVGLATADEILLLIGAALGDGDNVVGRRRHAAAVVADSTVPLDDASAEPLPCPATPCIRSARRRACPRLVLVGSAPRAPALDQYWAAGFGARLCRSERHFSQAPLPSVPGGSFGAASRFFSFSTPMIGVGKESAAHLNGSPLTPSPVW
jgi:hypothetical protein